MKKVFKLLSSLLLVSFVLVSLSSCKNNDAEKYFTKALEVIDMKLPYLSDEDFSEAISLLEKCIECDKTMWKAYRQINQLYLMKKDYNKIIEVFDLWTENGNTMDESKQFSYACTLYSNQDKEKAFSIFSDIYNKNKERIKDNTFYKKEESNFVVSVFSGIITKNIKDIPSIDFEFDPLDIEGSVEEYNALPIEDRLQDIFSDFETSFNYDREELIACYAGQ